MKKMKLIVAMILIINLGNACKETMICIGIDNADTVAVYYIDSFFDMTDEQEAFWETKSRENLNWAKEELSPLIIKDLQELRAIKRKLTKAEMERFFYKNPKSHLVKGAQHIAPDLAEFLGTLTPAQYAVFNKQLANTLKDQIEISQASPSEYEDLFQDLQKERLERLEDSVGGLSSEQTAIILKERYMDQETFKMKLDMRFLLFQEFSDRIRSMDDQNEREKFIKAWVTLPNFRSATQQAKFEEYSKWRHERGASYWKTLEDLLKPEQRQERLKSYDDYIENIVYFQKTVYEP